MQRFIRLLACLVLLFAWCNACWAQMTIPTRPGTIYHALQQPDNTQVVLDSVSVKKICARQFPAYLVIEDTDWQGGSTMIVKFCPSLQMHLGMKAEVTGNLTTEGGQRMITNTVVKAYQKTDGAIDYGAINKPAATPLSWPNSKISIAGTSCPTTPVVTPVLGSAESAHYYINIADCKGAPDGQVVWLTNKRIVTANGPIYTIAADNSEDDIKVYARSGATTADRAWNVIGVLGTNNGIRTISTVSGPDMDYWISMPQFSIFDSGKIGWAKSQLDGTYLTLPQKVVTAVFPGYFYVEESDRSAGVRVISSRYIAVGKVINISGANITTIDGEKCLTNCTLQIASNPTTQIAPLGMTNKSLGAGNWAWENDGSSRGQIGVEGGIGLNNVGLLVRIWGRITHIDAQRRWYVIDDGTGLQWVDGASSYTGVKVSLGEGTKFLPFAETNGELYQVGDYVEGVNGISSCVRIDGIVHRCLRQIGDFGKRGPPWFPTNKINRQGKPGV